MVDVASVSLSSERKSWLTAENGYLYSFIGNTCKLAVNIAKRTHGKTPPLGSGERKVSDLSLCHLCVYGGACGCSCVCGVCVCRGVCELPLGGFLAVSETQREREGILALVSLPPCVCAFGRLTLRECCIAARVSPHPWPFSLPTNGQETPQGNKPPHLTATNHHPHPHLSLSPPSVCV